MSTELREPMSVVIERETYSDALGRELLPLAQKCWEESSAEKGERCAFYGHRDIQIEPDFQLYKALSDTDRLILLTVRDGSALVGYAVIIVYVSPHHCKFIAANGDSLYVEPKYRIHSPVLIDKVISEVKRTEAVSLNWGVSPGSPLYEMLLKLGFVGDEVIMEKRLCA
jgi:hypothetical protein